MKTLVVVGLVVAAIAGFFVVDNARSNDVEEQLATIASEIAGRPVEVDCQGIIGDALDATAESGKVEFDEDGRPADRASLKRGVCRAIARFPEERLEAEYVCIYRREECPQSVVTSVEAIHTIAHESWHLAGEPDEGIAECYGLQSITWVSEQLGADPRQARTIARYVSLELYPKLPTAYLNNDCRDGGKLDLRKGTRGFP